MKILNPFKTFGFAVLMSFAAAISAGNELESTIEKAKQGEAYAQYFLALRYDFGEGMPENDQEAVKWYRKAADQGNDLAQMSLGWMYNSGEGVPESDQEAVKWYRKAAYQGNANAQTSLGAMYFDGEGVPQDNVRAYFWTNIAAVTNETARKNREVIKDSMTSQQIAEAQRLSAEFYENNQ
jgi:TPR repeat protein